VALTHEKWITVSDDVRSPVSLAHADYQSALLVAAPDAASSSAEQWLRSMFESAPAPVRTFIRLGWLMFGARLAPVPSPGHIAGWRIGLSQPDVVRIDVEWAVGLRAQLVVRVEESSAVFGTFVELNRLAARLVWRAIVPIHRLTARYLLARTARAHSAGKLPQLTA
jgi:hypothetical protein